MTLQFFVNNQELSLSPSQKNIKVVANSRNYLKARFMFQSKEWQKGSLYYAIFTQNGKSYKKFLGIEAGMAYNECYVSPEVLNEGTFTVSVFCDDLITTTTETIPVIASGYTEIIENQDTTPSVMEQMNQLMYKYANLCNDIYKECQNIEKNIIGGR